MTRPAQPLDIPSRHGNRLTYRDGRVTDLDGNPIAPEPTPAAPTPAPKTSWALPPTNLPKPPKPAPAPKPPKAKAPPTKRLAARPAKPALAHTFPTHMLTHPHGTQADTPPTRNGRGSVMYGSGAKTYLGPNFNPDGYKARPGSVVSRILQRLHAADDPANAFISRAEVVGGYGANRENWCNYFGRAIAAGLIRYVQDASGVLVGIALPQYSGTQHHTATSAPNLAELALQITAAQQSAAALAERLAVMSHHLGALAALSATAAEHAATAAEHTPATQH
jgi:hypothetical protein